MCVLCGSFFQKKKYLFDCAQHYQMFNSIDLNLVIFFIHCFCQTFNETISNSVNSCSILVHLNQYKQQTFAIFQIKITFIFYWLVVCLVRNSLNLHLISFHFISPTKRNETKTKKKAHNKNSGSQFNVVQHRTLMRLWANDPISCNEFSFSDNSFLERGYTENRKCLSMFMHKIQCQSNRMLALFLSIDTKNTIGFSHQNIGKHSNLILQFHMPFTKLHMHVMMLFLFFFFFLLVSNRFSFKKYRFLPNSCLS